MYVIYILYMYLMVAKRGHIFNVNHKLDVFPVIFHT